MAKKFPKSEAIQNATTDNSDAYVMWGDDLASKQEAIRASSGSLEEFTGINKAEAYRRWGLDYSNLDTNTGGRPGLTRSAYDYFRPDEAVPNKIKEILRKSEDIYQRVGLVKNVIDLMGDFAVQGIRLSHPNKRIERFYRHWFKKVKGKDRSERFLNNLYKSANVVINRQTAKLSLKAADKMYKTTATADMDVSDIGNDNIEKREVPWKYTFIDPYFVDVAGGQLSSFVTNKRYQLTIPGTLRKIISNPRNDGEKSIVNSLPTQILEAAKAKTPYPLDPDKTIVFHYKKDDWQTWAFPMIYAIMDDIIVVEKLKLADMAALDGAISNIRIFKLGSLEHKIAPTKAATAKLAQILGNNVGGGTMDLVWGPDIDLLESNTNVHNFLGEGKYVPHLNSIYAGLGIPPTLTGTFGGGTTNNFISLKTLTQRLQYGRDVLVDFWDKEIALVQKAMGFRYAAKVEFDRMDLSNEDAEKALLIQLADRNIISDELIQNRFGFDSDMEKSRLNRESRERDSERMVQKSGPWFDPQLENSLKKIALQTGIVSPSQVGLELEKKKGGEKNAMEMKVPSIPKMGGGDPSSPQSPLNISDKQPGQPGQGRPKNSKDTEKRKTKKFSPQTGASLILWANETQDKINDIINPIILDFYNKKNLRSLSNEQSKELESVKTKIFFGIDPFDQVSSDTIQTIFANINQEETKNLAMGYNNWLKQLSSQLDKQLTVEEQKQAKSSFYSYIYST
jgi:hypothetical protein